MLNHWTKKIIVEEGHTVAQLVHILYVGDFFGFLDILVYFISQNTIVASRLCILSFAMWNVSGFI